MRYTVTTSEYAVGGIIIRDDEHPIWMSIHDKNMLLSIATVLENETAPLHAEIARLQAENAKLVAGIKSLIEAQNRGIAANEPFNDAFYKGRVDSMWHTVKALETILAESETDNA